MEQIISHLLGDYIFQNSHIANTKTKNTLVCILHCVIYALCFSWFASVNQIILIGLLHFPIDRFRLAKYWIMLVNCKLITHKLYKTFDGEHFDDCKIVNGEYELGNKAHYSNIINTRWGYIGFPNTETGFPKETPIWLSTWLLFIIDNIFHLVINYSIIKFIE